MELLFIAIISYLLGSIPSGLVLAKLFKKGDIRKKGSGNIGATNALRVGGKALGICTLVADVLKGIIAVIIAQHISDYDLGHVCIAALFAVLGHVFPVWLKLNGGKGVATTIAVLLYVAPGVGLIGMLMWIATFVTTRMVSAASIVMMVSATLSAFISQPDEVVLLALSTSIIVIARHSENIKRILKGTENRM